MTSHEDAVELEIEMEAELKLVEASSPLDDIGAPSSWAFDPSDVVREEVGLRNLLGAAEALARTAEPSGVFIEEMLPPALAANVLNAVGGRPILDDPRLLPRHPRRLPHSDPVAVDFPAVKPVRPDPRLADHPAGSPIRVADGGGHVAGPTFEYLPATDASPTIDLPVPVIADGWG